MSYVTRSQTRFSGCTLHKLLLFSYSYRPGTVLFTRRLLFYIRTAGRQTVSCRILFSFFYLIELCKCIFYTSVARTVRGVIRKYPGLFQPPNVSCRISQSAVTTPGGSGGYCSTEKQSNRRISDHRRARKLVAKRVE